MRGKLAAFYFSSCILCAVKKLERLAPNETQDVWKEAIEEITQLGETTSPSQDNVSTRLIYCGHWETEGSEEPVFVSRKMVVIWAMLFFTHNTEEIR